MNVDHPPEPPHSDTGDSVVEIVQETDEERGEEETVEPAPDHPPSQMYWDGFLEEMKRMKGKGHASPDEWYADLLLEAREYVAKHSSA
jgi:hypothetical protein